MVKRHELRATLLSRTCPDLKERGETGRRVADHTLEAMAPMIRAIMPVLFGTDALEVQRKEQVRYRTLLEAYEAGLGLPDF